MYLYSVSEIVDQRILVVNDVFTTGCTLKAVAATLKPARVSWVGGCALTVQPIGSLKSMNRNCERYEVSHECLN